MADRRMFSKKIIDSDAFLDMPLSTQALYFHLSMRADDEGFVSNPKRIKQMIGASDDDLKLLILKRFILTFDSGVVVIKHWKIHNYIQSDRFVPTTYVEERKTLGFDEKKAYTEIENAMYTECIQNVSKMDTQDREGKSKYSSNIIIPPKSPLTEKENNNKKPTKSEVVTYFTETLHRSEEEGQRFWAWNENRGWQVGNSPIRKWQLFADAWKNENVQSKGQLERQYGETDICNYFSDLHDFDNIEV